MTERGRRHVARSRHEFVVGPSRVHWTGDRLLFEIDEVGVPWPRRVRGRVTVWPSALVRFGVALDDGGRHRWGPIAPCARVEAAFDEPSLRWAGSGYLDSNEGDEPIDRPFADWDWSRAALAGGATAVVYDVRQKNGRDRVIARRFAPDGGVESFEPPPRQPLPRSAWRLGRTMRSEPGTPARLVQTLEDTPFYVRSLVESALCGERVQSVHETLHVARLVSTPVRLMLPWRMPRRR